MLSTTENKALMAEARESLRGKWGLAVGAMLLYFVIIAVAQAIPKIGGVIGLVITGPFTLGFAIFALSLSRRDYPGIGKLFEGFNRFWIALGTYLLQTLFILLWTLLLIVPGIMAGFSYAMTFFILADDDTIGPRQAISKSKEMMMGNRWKFFCLICRFWGWSLLCVLTCGIGFIWLFPYMMISTAKFYDDLLQDSSEVPSCAAEGNVA